MFKTRRATANLPKWACLVRNVQTSSNSSFLCKFSSIGLLGQKRGDIFKFTIFVQKSVRINELLEISDFFQKREIVQNSVQLWFCLKLASKRYAQLWFCFKCAPFVNNRRKTLKLCKAVLDSTCKKQRAQSCCCSKLALNHTGQLFFSFKLARIVTNVKLKKTPCACFLLREIGVKTLCATVVLLRIGVFC